MRAKFIYESIDDIFKPKSEEEINKNVNKLIEHHKKYIYKETPDYLVFIFDLAGDEEQTSIDVFNIIRKFGGVSFSSNYSNSKEYIFNYYNAYGAYIIILDKLSGKTYITQKRRREIIDAQRDMVILTGDKAGEFLEKYGL